MKKQIGKSCVAALALVLAIVGTNSASAQSFKKMKVKGNVALSQVVSGGASVWAIASNGNPYIFNGKQFIAASTTLSVSQISVGGGDSAAFGRPEWASMGRRHWHRVALQVR